MKHTSDRTPGKFDIPLKAKELAGYTIRITSNEKNFPKRYRFTVTAKIQEKAMYIVDCIMMAWELYPNNQIELDRKILYLKEAKASCRSMSTMIEIAASTFNVNAGTFEHWIRQVTELRDHINAWILSDIGRFKKGAN